MQLDDSLAPKGRFVRRYSALPEGVYARVAPTPVSSPGWLHFNVDLAREIGLVPEEWSGPQGLEVLAGNRPVSTGEPIAMAYAGHQFGQWVPQLGDGRAIQIAEVLDAAGRVHGLQLKGAGTTPFSRQGDGRAALGPVLREYLLSEAMAGLGVPTTRALAAVTTGEAVQRQTPEPGAILARVARGFVRVGTFEYFAARGQDQTVREIADLVRSETGIEEAENANPYRGWFERVIAAQADLISRWMSIGFIHGVMNTDNMSVYGETIDYGPCAFMDAFDPNRVFSSIDRQGRYAYQQQPSIGLWNLTRLGESVLSLLGDSTEEAVEWAQGALGRYADQFHRAYDEAFAKKLGFGEANEITRSLVADLLAIMAAQGADFTRTFRDLTPLCTAAREGTAGTLPHFGDAAALMPWAERWQSALYAEGKSSSEPEALMDSVNPRYIPRNHRVQQAIDDCAQRGDLSSFESLLKATTHPFLDNPEFMALANPPEAHEVVRETFCGT
ncbi:MAG: YdiU family protein [Myxococcota bacterium]|nr:YdiU family protein [Myxococcota bacterium]